MQEFKLGAEMGFGSDQIDLRSDQRGFGSDQIPLGAEQSFNPPMQEFALGAEQSFDQSYDQPVQVGYLVHFGGMALVWIACI